VAAVVLALVAAMLSVWSALRRLKSVARLAASAQASDGLERASRARVLQRLAPESPMGSLSREVLEAPSERAAIATLNEALGDVARELDVGREVPKSATRVALATGTLLALIEIGRLLPQGAARALPTAGGSFAVGLVGASLCLLIARGADDRARSARDGWDRLGRTLERLLRESHNVGRAEGDGVDPEAFAD